MNRHHSTGRSTNRRTTKRQTYAEVVAIIPMIGPGTGSLKRCIRCGKEFQAGEHWRKIGSADGAYFVGAHNACLVEKR